MKTLECKKLKSWYKKVKFSGKVQMYNRKTKIKKLDRHTKETSPDEPSYKCGQHFDDIDDVSAISERSFCESGIELLDTSLESEDTCGSVLQNKNISLPAIPAFRRENDFEKFATKGLTNSSAIQNSTPVTHPKNRRATVGYVECEKQSFPVLPGYLGNSPDKSTLPAARRISLGSHGQPGSVNSLPIPKRARKGLAMLFKSRKHKVVSIRKKSIKRKVKSPACNEETLDLSTVSSEGLLEFFEGLSPKKRSVSFNFSGESGKSDSSSLRSQASKDSPVHQDICQVKPYVVKRKILRTQFHRLMAETERLREKDVEIRAKFIELQQKRLLLSLDLNPNSTELFHLTQPNKGKEDPKPSTKMSTLQSSMSRGLTGWSRSKSAPDLVNFSSDLPLKKLLSGSIANLITTDIIWV